MTQEPSADGPALRRSHRGQNVTQQELDARCDVLDSRERKVLALYYGLDGYGPHFLQSVAALLAIPVHRAIRIRDRARERVRTNNEELAAARERRATIMRSIIEKKHRQRLILTRQLKELRRQLRQLEL